MSVSSESLVATPSLWRVRPFVMLWSASLLLGFGGKVYELTLPLLMYDLTHSSVSMASMRTAELLPNLLLGVIVGVWVDRVNKRKWVQSMVALQMIVLIGLVLLARGGVSLLWPYFLAGFLLMSFNYGYFNAQVSLTKLTVPTPMLTDANAKFSFVETLISVTGPAITGIVLLFSRLSDGLVLTVILYLLSLLLLSRIQLEESTYSAKQPFWAALAEGWRALHGNKTLWWATWLVVALNATQSMFNATILYFAQSDLHLTSMWLGLVLASGGIGGFLSSLVVNALSKRIGMGSTLGVAIGGWVLSSGIVFVSHDAVLAATGVCLNGFCFTLYVVCIYTVRQTTTPAHLMGRISGLTGSLFRLGMPVTTYLSGWMCVWWGSSSVFLATGLLTGVILVGYVMSPLRRTLQVR